MFSCWVFFFVLNEGFYFYLTGLKFKSLISFLNWSPVSSNLYDCTCTCIVPLAFFKYSFFVQVHQIKCAFTPLHLFSYHLNLTFLYFDCTLGFCNFLLLLIFLKTIEPTTNGFFPSPKLIFPETPCLLMKVKPLCLSHREKIYL